MKQYRSNEHENLCANIIKSTFPDLIVKTNDIINLTTQTCDIIINDNIDNNIMFINPETNILTQSGNPSRIEIGLWIKNLGVKAWVDAKYLTNTSILSETVHRNIRNAKYLDGELWLVFFGGGYTLEVIQVLRYYMRLENAFNVRLLDKNMFSNELLKYA